MKQKFNIINSTCVPLPLENVDTDQIIPARFLKATTKEGFGENLFRDWRYDKQGNKIESFVLNDPTYGGQILVAGKNFGSGSSREHAAWAIADYGFRVVVSSFFADIHKNNELNNFVLPVVVSEPFLKELFDSVFANPKTEVEVNLPEQTITNKATGKSEHFEINAYKKHCLMNGLDDIDFLVENKDKIESWEKKHRRDIAELADKGLLKRVHGGAVTTSTLLSEPLFSVKSQMDIGLKDAIAQEAIKYVAPGDVIAIGGGTTAYVFAQHLLESQQSSGITILTNSIPVAELVQALESKDVEVIVTGGVITRSNSLVGPIADKVVASLRVNTVFLGTHSVSIPRGFLMPNSLEAATDMAMMDIADRTIVLTDHTKWSCTSLSLFARFDQVDTVITDDGLDPDSAAKTKDLVKELVLAHQSEIIEESE